MDKKQKLAKMIDTEKFLREQDSPELYESINKIRSKGHQLARDVGYEDAEANESLPPAEQLRILKEFMAKQRMDAPAKSLLNPESEESDWADNLAYNDFFSPEQTKSGYQMGRMADSSDGTLESAVRKEERDLEDASEKMNPLAKLMTKLHPATDKLPNPAKHEDYMRELDNHVDNSTDKDNMFRVDKIKKAMNRGNSY